MWRKRRLLFVSGAIKMSNFSTVLVVHCGKTNTKHQKASLASANTSGERKVFSFTLLLNNRLVIRKKRFVHVNRTNLAYFDLINENIIPRLPSSFWIPTYCLSVTCDRRSFVECGRYSKRCLQHYFKEIPFPVVHIPAFVRPQWNNMTVFWSHILTLPIKNVEFSYYPNKSPGYS